MKFTKWPDVEAFVETLLQKTPFELIEAITGYMLEAQQRRDSFAAETILVEMRNQLGGRAYIDRPRRGLLAAQRLRLRPGIKFQSSGRQEEAILQWSGSRWEVEVVPPGEGRLRLRQVQQRNRPKRGE